jgi:hypothetical protein
MQFLTKLESFFGQFEYTWLLVGIRVIWGSLDAAFQKCQEMVVTQLAAGTVQAPTDVQEIHDYHLSSKENTKQVRKKTKQNERTSFP